MRAWERATVSSKCTGLLADLFSHRAHEEMWRECGRYKSGKVMDVPFLKERHTVTARKRLLFITSRFPYPPLSGGKLFLLNVAEALRDYDMTLLSFCSTDGEMSFRPTDGVFTEIHRVRLPKWRSYGNVLAAMPGRKPLQLAYYKSREFQAKVDQLLPEHDAVVSHLIRCGEYVSKCRTNVPRILMMADAISLAYQRMTQLSGAPLLWHVLYRLELSRLLKYERDCPKEFDQVWLHSEVDREFLGLNGDSVRIIPIGTDLEEYPFRPNCAGSVIAFIGNLSFSLNLDACRHFIQAVLPVLRARDDIRFRIIGSCPAKVRRDLEMTPGVEVTGTVEHIANAVEDVFCGICPIRAGAGIQNKILNYLALGIPCVTSQVGLEGLEAEDGKDLLVYKNLDEAVTMLRRLHEDSELRCELARNGRKLVERAHDWKKIHKMIRKDISDVFGARPLLRQ
jgi:glycosyltransferase involved in cell wall biosynthesis